MSPPDTDAEHRAAMAEVERIHYYVAIAALTILTIAAVVLLWIMLPPNPNQPPI